LSFVGAGLLAQSPIRLSSVNLESTNNLLAVQTRCCNKAMTLPNYALYRQLFSELTALPGVTAVPPRSPPVRGFSGGATLTINGKPAIIRTDRSGQITLRLWGTNEGRNFNDNGSRDELPVAIINRSMARRYWPNESAIGKQFETATTKLRIGVRCRTAA
jgi:hypothetical protein